MILNRLLIFVLLTIFISCAIGKSEYQNYAEENCLILDPKEYKNCRLNHLIQDFETKGAFLSYQGHGILGWLSSFELDNLVANSDFSAYKSGYPVQGILNMIKIANQKKVGLLFCVDMIDEAVYNFLPKFKLVEQSEYLNLDTKNLIFNY